MKEEKGLNDFKFGTFGGRFPSDGAASMAVKGLHFPSLVFFTGEKEANDQRYGQLDSVVVSEYCGVCDGPF